MRALTGSALVALLLAPCIVLAQSSTESRKSESDEAQIRRIENEYVVARQHDDSTALGRMLAPEFMSIASTGRVENRSFIVSHTGVAPSGARISAMAIDSLDVRMVDASNAVVVGRRTVTTNDTGALRFMHVFAKRHGRWQMVAAAVTPIR